MMILHAFVQVIKLYTLLILISVYNVVLILFQMLKKLHVFVHLVLFHKVIIVCQLSDVNLMKILLMDNVNVNMDGLELDLLVFRLVELINIMMVKIVSVKKDMLNLIQFVNNVEVVVYLMFQKLHVFVMTHYNFMISKKDNV